MKESSLAVSLGLAAIDGLTCAFIAILILALILIGPGSSPSASDSDTAQMLLVHIEGEGGAAHSIDLRILVDVTVDGQPLDLDVESAGRLVRLRGFEKRNLVRPGGGVWWKDCQTTAANFCVAEMFVTKAKHNATAWRIRLRVADAGDSFTASAVSYNAWLKLEGSEVQGLVLSPDKPLVACVNWSAKTVQAPCP